MTKPIYQHDCEVCEFIQNLVVEGTHYDVYRCSSGLCNKVVGASWIARFSDEPDQYWSMPWGVLKTVDPKSDVTPLLREVQRIAEERR